MVKELLPIVAAMNDKVRQAHYIQKLARLVNVDERTIEAELGRMKLKPEQRRITTPAPERSAHSLRAITSNRLEEEYLTLLLQHPEYKANSETIPPEYFLNSENREVFTVWNKVDDLDKLRDTLNQALHEHLDLIAGRELPSDHLDEKDVDYRYRLEERYYKNLAAKTAETLALEVQEKGAGADLIKLQKDKIDYDTRLKDIYERKSQRRLESRR